MVSFTRIAICAVAIVLAGVAAVAQDKVDPTGVWQVTIETPQQPVTRTLILKADGEKITGNFKGPQGELAVTGTVKGNEIKITYVVPFNGNDLNITMTGTMEKDSVKGTADFGGLASGAWSGVRQKEGQSAPAATPAPAASSGSVDVTGGWAFTVETDQGSGAPTFTFKQEGEKLTGMYKGMFGEAPVQGTVKGSEINFSVKVRAQDTDVTLVYTGTAEKDSMKGTVKLGEMGNGKWTAKRQ